MAGKNSDSCHQGRMDREFLFPPAVILSCLIIVRGTNGYIRSWKKLEIALSKQDYKFTIIDILTLSSGSLPSAV